MGADLGLGCRIEGRAAGALANWRHRQATFRIAFRDLNSPRYHHPALAPNLAELFVVDSSEQIGYKAGCRNEAVLHLDRCRFRRRDLKGSAARPRRQTSLSDSRWTERASTHRWSVTTTVTMNCGSSTLARRSQDQPAAYPHKVGCTDCGSDG